MSELLHLAVALDGAGWHPAAWRDPSARPADLFTAPYWTDLAATAERGLLDLVTIEDSFGLQSTSWTGVDDRTDQVRGRLEAVLIASLIGPRTTHLGIVPTANVTHSEPFHIASATATLDHVSRGRGGWRPQVSGRPGEARHVGLRTLPEIDPTRIAGGIDNADPETAQVFADLFDEAADVVEVVRRLWDSWEDGAIVKDVATGRYIDRDRLHHVDFDGRFFSVKGPSIVPRPPQGQPLVAVLAHGRVPFELAAQQADVVFVTPAGGFLADDTPAGWLAQVRAAEHAVGRAGRFADPLRVWGDLVVLLDDIPGAAASRLARLNEIDGAEYRSDALVFAGTPGELADLLAAWQADGIEGFRLRPGVITHDLDQIVDGLVPILQQRGTFRRSYADSTLRARLGLARPASRYTDHVASGPHQAA